MLYSKQDVNKVMTKGLVNMADIQPTRLRYLWYPYIPIGQVTIMRGDPGCGKTMLALSIAAIASNGYNFPGDVDPDAPPAGSSEAAFKTYHDCRSKKVLFITAEDDLSSSVRPRLDKAGADANQILAVERSAASCLTFTDDWFMKYIAACTPGLIIVDPVQAFMGSGIDGHRANEVRPIMGHLAELAETFGVPIILIEHLNKNSGGKAIYRGLGSIDFTAAARSVIMVGEHEGKKGFAHIKTNTAEKGHPVGFDIVDGKLEFDINTTLTEDDISGSFVKTAAPNYKKGASLDEAVYFLQETLKNGPRPSKDIKIMARPFDISENTLRLAREELGIVIKRNPEVGGGSTSTWQLSDWKPDEEQMMVVF